MFIFINVLVMDITKTKVINLKKSRILILTRWLLSQNRPGMKC